MPQLCQWAFRAANSGRPGPVYLDLPSNVLCEGFDPEQFPILNPGQYRATNPPIAAAKVIEKAADLLVSAEWPLLHAGGGVLQSGAWEEFVQLAEHLSAAVTTSLTARGVIPEDHPLCLIPSSYGALGAQATADVLLLVGGRMGAMDFWGQPPAWGPPEAQKWIQIDIDPESIGLNRPVDLALVGDARTTLGALLEAVKARTGEKPENPQFQDAREALAVWMRQWEEGADSHSTPIHPLRLMREVREFFPRETIMCSDGGTTAVWAFYLNRIYEPRTFLWASDSGHLGSGVPYAIGAKLARPNLPVYCVTGDGSFGFNAMELETALRVNAPVVVIIANDFGWGMIRSAQKAVHGERYVGVDFHQGTRYDKLAEALGCYGERVTEPEGIRPALQRAVDSGIPAVLDVIVDPEVHGFPPDLEVLDGIWMEGCDRE